MLTNSAECSKNFQSIKETCITTGLSQYSLRQGCRNGTVPHIRIGTKILVNVPLLIDKLNKESAGACH